MCMQVTALTYLCYAPQEEPRLGPSDVNIAFWADPQNLFAELDGTERTCPGNLGDPT